MLAFYDVSLPFQAGEEPAHARGRADGDLRLLPRRVARPGRAPAARRGGRARGGRRLARDARRLREPDRPRRADPRRRAFAPGLGRAPARAVAAPRAPRRGGGRARRRRRRRAARGGEGRVPRLEGLGPVRPAGGPGRRRLRLGRELRRDRVPVRAHRRADRDRAAARAVLARRDPERVPQRPLGRGAVDHRDQRRCAGSLERPVPAGPRADDLPARPRERRDQGASRRPPRRAGDAGRPRPARDRHDRVPRRQRRRRRRRARARRRVHGLELRAESAPAPAGERALRHRPAQHPRVGLPRDPAGVRRARRSGPRTARPGCSR